MSNEPPPFRDHPAVRAVIGFGRAPDPVDAAIERHRAAREELQRAAGGVDAASNADGAAWADLLATRPGDVPGAVRLLRYVSGSPASEVVEDPQDLLRQLLAAVEAGETSERQCEGAPGGAEPQAVSEPDPALAVVAEFRRVWDAANAAAGAAPDGDVPEAHVRAIDEAYEALRAARPTTADGFRLLAETWAYRLDGEIAGGTVEGHAAASLIAAAGVCLPGSTGSQVSPALAELIARHQDLVRQSEARGLSDAVADPLFDEAWSVFRQACSFPIAGSADLAAKVDLMAAEITEGVERGEIDTAMHAWNCLRSDLLRLKGVELAGAAESVKATSIRDWQAEAAMHPGFVPYPAHAPRILIDLEGAIRGETGRLLELAEAEIARRRAAYDGFHDPSVWPQVERDLRREMRMDALAVAAGSLPADDGAADPRLCALVTAWEAAERAGNAPDRSDEERAPLIDHASGLLRDVYAFPARTMADICAKLPAYRDEAANTGDAPDAPDSEVTLEACALRGLVADLERLAAERTTGPEHPDAELLRLIASVEAAQVRCDAAHTIWAEAEKAAAATRPVQPDELRRANDFQHFWGVAANPHSPEFYTADEVAKFRQYEPVGHANVKAETAARARAAEIVAAFWGWQAQIRAHDEAFGVAALDRAHDETCADYQTALNAVMSARPATLAGVLAKARISLSEDTIEFDRLLRDDLLAMSGSLA